jgi:hypothetical protein
MLETRGKKTQLRKHGEGVFSGLGGRRRHTLQDDLILQARVFTLKGAVAPSASTASSAKSNPASDGNTLQGPPCDSGAGSRMSCKPAQGRRSQTAARGAHDRPAVTSDPHFCPHQQAEGAGSHAGGMQPRQVDALLRLLTRQLGSPDPRVKQSARQLLHASNRTATRATVAPLRLRSLCRDSRRPSGASLARRSKRPKVGRQ